MDNIEIEWGEYENAWDEWADWVYARNAWDEENHHRKLDGMDCWELEG